MKNITSQPQQKKVLGLELIRFISALAVLVWHYQHFSYIASIPSGFIENQQPLHWILEKLYTHGNYGVQVFWCISGYIFFFKYRKEITQGRLGWKNFFLLRFSRLYPLHIATLLCVLILQALYFNINNYYFVYQNNDLFHFALQIFLASNWGFENGYSFNGPIWSISVEVLVYFLFFILLSNFGGSSWVSALMIVLCLAARAFKLANPVFECLAFFYAGGLAATLSQSAVVSRNRSMAKLLSVFFLILIPLGISSFAFSGVKAIALIFLFIYTPIVLFFTAEGVRIPSSIERYVEAAGNMTYASYLAHFPIQLLIVLFFSYMKISVPFYNVFFFLFFIACVLFSSRLIFKHFEMPLQRYIRTRCIVYH